MYNLHYKQRNFEYSLLFYTVYMSELPIVFEGTAQELDGLPDDQFMTLVRPLVGKITRHEELYLFGIRKGK